MSAKIFVCSADDQNRIRFLSVLLHDLLPWMIAVGAVTLLFVGVQTLVGSIRPDTSVIDVSAVLYSHAQPFYYALIVMGVLLARRSSNTWTWILIAILILFFANQGASSLSTIWMPNGILHTMISMIGLLAIGRLGEYFHMHYIIKLKQPRLTSYAIALYFSLVVITVFLNSQFFYEFLQKAST